MAKDRRKDMYEAIAPFLEVKPGKIADAAIVAIGHNGNVRVFGCEYTSELLTLALSRIMQSEVEHHVQSSGDHHSDYGPGDGYRGHHRSD